MSSAPKSLGEASSIPPQIRSEPRPEPVALCCRDWPAGFPDYLSKLSPLVRPGGLILAHNFDQTGAYGRVVTANPDLETMVPGGSLAVTLKKR
jgi:hypothetical protein